MSTKHHKVYAEFESIWSQFIPGHEESFPMIMEYMDCLIETNQKVNLVSRKLDDKTLFIEHIIDCALALPYLTDGDDIIDFGTGGGLPGIILAICLPGSAVALFDKSAKKIHFLEKMIDELGLSNVRASQNVKDLPTEKVTLVSRAVGPMERILSFTESWPFDIKRYLFYKARREKIDEEILEIAQHPFQIDVQPLKFPDPEKSRHLVVLQA